MTSTDAFPSLMTPFRLGQLELRNRIVHLPTATLYATAGGESRRTIAYAAARAAGGAGLLILGNRMVHPTSTVGMPRYAWAFRRENAAADREMVEAVRSEGTAIVAQLNHFGMSGWSEASDDPRYLLGPSRLKSPVSAEASRPMSPSEMTEMVEWWRVSAELCAESGFDGVEVHMAHSYLLHEFLSPLYNRRTDEYGGDSAARSKYPAEILAAIRRSIGPDVVLGVRLSLTDGLPGGLGPADAAGIARAMAAAAQIDYVGLTAAGDETLEMQIAPSDMPGWWLEDVTRQFGREFEGEVPCIAAGGITTPEEGERIIASGAAELVGLSRALLADPDWAEKSRLGEPRRIRPCIRCNQGCIERLYRGFPVTCTVNPEAGREDIFRRGRLQGRAMGGERWAIVGGGPAGLTAAHEMARRGAIVDLFERAPAVGGRLRWASESPGREPFGRLVSFLEASALDAGVNVRTQTEATEDLVQSLNATGVVVATGALPAAEHGRLELPELQPDTSKSSVSLTTGWEVIQDRVPEGREIVIYDTDGTRYGAAVAEILLRAGRHVTLITPEAVAFPGLIPTLEWKTVLERLRDGRFRTLCNTGIARVELGSVVAQALDDGATHEIPADAVVSVFGWTADTTLAERLRAANVPFIEIGDCFAARRLDHAIWEGTLVGRGLLERREWFIAEGELENWPVSAPST